MTRCAFCDYGVEYATCTCDTDPNTEAFSFDPMAREEAEAARWQREMDAYEDGKGPLPRGEGSL